MRHQENIDFFAVLGTLNLNNRKGTVGDPHDSR